MRRGGVLGARRTSRANVRARAIGLPGLDVGLPEDVAELGVVRRPTARVASSRGTASAKRPGEEVREPEHLHRFAPLDRSRRQLVDDRREPLDRAPMIVGVVVGDAEQERDVRPARAVERA